MCLIMTAFAALMFTVLWVMSKKHGKDVKSFKTTLLMFWGGQPLCGAWTELRL